MKLLLFAILLSGCIKPLKPGYIRIDKPIPEELIDCKDQLPALPASNNVNDKTSAKLLLAYEAAMQHCINDAEAIRGLSSSE